MQKFDKRQSNQHKTLKIVLIYLSWIYNKAKCTLKDNR